MSAKTRAAVPSHQDRRENETNASVVALPSAQRNSLEQLLRALVADIVRDALIGQSPAEQPALVDRAGLAKALSVSVPTVDAHRKKHSSFPTFCLTPECPRFEVAAVVEWLRGTR
jgi:hypothetical protein